MTETTDTETGDADEPETSDSSEQPTRQVRPSRQKNDDEQEASTTDTSGSTDEEPAAEEADDGFVEAQLGQTIAERYRIESHIGGGGMGEVFRAEHVMMKKTVAVKLLRPGAAEQENVVERFRREAQAAANLEHPNVCAATDFGQTDEGAFFLVMEYVDGQTLSGLIEQTGPLPAARAVAIADEIAAALERAHEMGIVHRDLKPENVMLVDDETGAATVKVLDFGVSRVQMADDMPSLTKTGAVFGTPHYMSPEQAAGESVDLRADLYGLGGVLYEMLTGRPVFVAEKSMQVMVSHLRDQPDPPTEVVDRLELPPGLESLVLDLLKKDPDDRPAGATDVRGRLEGIRQKIDPTDAESSAGGGSTIEIDVPTGRLLERARDTSRQLIGNLDDYLPDSLGATAKDSRIVAAFGIFAAACAALFVVVLLYAGTMLFAPGDKEAMRADLSAARADYTSRQELQPAVDALEKGNGSEAVRLLEDLDKPDEPNAHRQYLLGRAHSEARRETEALEHYRRAVELEGDYIVDNRVLEDLVDALGSSRKKRHELAQQVLGAHLDRPAIRDRLAEVAWKYDKGRTRGRAKSLLEQNELIGELPYWLQYSIELRHAQGCKEHRKVIDKIVDLGDPKALGMLRILDEHPRRGCGVLKTKDCYGCIREELSSAVKALEE